MNAVICDGWTLLKSREDWIMWSGMVNCDTTEEPAAYPAFAQVVSDGSQWTSPQYLLEENLSDMLDLLSRK